MNIIGKQVMAGDHISDLAMDSPHDLARGLGWRFNDHRIPELHMAFFMPRVSLHSMFKGGRVMFQANLLFERESHGANRQRAR